MPSIKIIFGTDHVRNYLEGNSIGNEDNIGGLYEYTFNTEDEVKAFLLGIDEAMGWQDYHILEEGEEYSTNHHPQHPSTSQF